MVEQRSGRHIQDKSFLQDMSRRFAYVVGYRGISRRRFIMHKQTRSFPARDSSLEVCNEAPAKGRRERTRRDFLKSAGQATAVVVATGASGKDVSAEPKRCEDFTFPLGVEPTDRASNRYTKSFKCRYDAGKTARERPIVYQTPNGDDRFYITKLASHTKALPHNANGEVDLAAYETLVKARTTRDPTDFEAITLGLGRKLTSPQAGLAMDLEGPDSHHVALPAPPRFDSAQQASEAAELYWMALARDVNFNDYQSDPIIARAAQDLSRLSDFRGPKEGGSVTPNTIFRNSTRGDLNGPWLSQFLSLDFFFGANFVSQTMKTVVAGVDYMSDFASWLRVQNGAEPTEIAYDPIPRYIRNLRDLAQWVHVDALYQAYLHACLILLAQGTRLDPGLPLYGSTRQAGFAQCGGPHILSLVTEVATRALKAVWYQKWFVHHRLRPEEFGGKVHTRKLGIVNSPVHSDLLGSPVLEETFSRYGSYLLPQAFAEGSPTHSSYASGHATVAGACVTALKAFFDETDIVKNPMLVSGDGTGLIPYQGEPLTVGGELNKVASNVANGRNGAGIHWRTDAVNGLALGEEVTIGILQEQKLTYNDNVTMSLTKFDGTQITI